MLEEPIDNEVAILLLHQQKHKIKIKPPIVNISEWALKPNYVSSLTAWLIRIQEEPQKSISAMSSSSLLITGSIQACSALAESLCASINFCKYLEV